MANTDTTIIKKLKHDINQKNKTRREIEKRITAVRLWKDELESSKCFQKQKRYSASIKRYIAEIEGLRTKLNQMNEGLDKRINELGGFSVSEIKESRSQLEQEIRNMENDGNLKEKKSRRSKDIEGIKNAREKLAELKGKGGLQRKIEKANKQLTEDIAEVEHVTGKIVKLSSRLRKVSKGAGPGGEKMAPEEKDKYLFTQELKRIVCERAIYGSQSETR
ncbi:hypothetical protein LCGC14_1278420 [marine sediment metagenome]|uniref:Uncharacterized protein n=1 Tax=marine sediment metagenome TaxID=412755 RepID=A0A0F9LH74_9ZZZZ